MSRHDGQCRLPASGRNDVWHVVDSPRLGRIRDPTVQWVRSRRPTDTLGAHATRRPRVRSRGDAGDGHARRAPPPTIPVLPASRASESRGRVHATATPPAQHTRSMIACGRFFCGVWSHASHSFPPKLFWSPEGKVRTPIFNTQSFLQKKGTSSTTGPYDITQPPQMLNA